MKILLVSEFFPTTLDGETHGGVEARCFALADQLSRQHSVTVLCSYQSGPREGYLGRIRVIRIGPPHSFTQGGSLWYRLIFFFRACSRGVREEWDVVDGYNFLCYPIAWYIGWRKRAARIATYHDVWVGQWFRQIGFATGLVGEVIERITLRLPWSRIIAVSNYTKLQLIRVGLTEKKIAIVHNGVTLDLFNIPVVPFAERRPTILCIGRLVKYKRIDRVIRIMKELVAQVPNCRAVIIGDGPERKDLETLARTLGVDDLVQFLGFLPNKKDVIYNHLSYAKVFCLPSITEGFGIVTVEALARGTPYVSSDIPATREVTHDGIGGFLVSRDDDHEFVKGLVQLLQDQAVWNEKSSAGLRLAKEYQWQELAKLIERIYADAR